MAAEVRVALCIARFYEELAQALERSAREVLQAAAVGTVDSYAVPGAFELPLIAGYAARSGRYDAIVALGAVIRGETDHYRYVCGEAARGLQDVQCSTGVPVGFGLLTVDSLEQARARVRGGAKRDSGAHAAQAALAGLGVKRQLA
jgi:6,7-dimethyl-8-ribityllumazine synthase